MEQDTKQSVTVRLVANSGVLVTWGAFRILVDAIYGKNRYFSPPQKEIQKAVFGLSSVYQNVDVLLVTHRHTDHFDAAYVDEYAQNNSVMGVYVPTASGDSGSFLEDQRPLPKAAARGVLHEICPESKVQERIFLGVDCAATFLRTRHLDGDSYSAIHHYSILLEIGGCRILFAADADRNDENRQQFAALGHLDAVFVTPLFFSDLHSQRFLAETCPGQTVLYHIPFAQDDVSGLRSLADRELSRNHGFPLSVLMEPGDKIPIPE